MSSTLPRKPLKTTLIERLKSMRIWKEKPTFIHKKIELERHPNNPLLSPIHGSDWESWQTFNPAAIEIDGTVYLFYRAIGEDGMSRVGLAISEDGFTIDERLDEPIFTYQGIQDSRIKS